MFDFNGRCALVTGSGSGMGRTHAAGFAAAGAKVIVHDIDGAGAEATAAMVRARGAAAHVIVNDIRDVRGFADALSAAEAAFAPVDILVNNAGLSGRALPFDAIDEETFDRLIGVHVKGSFFAAQAVAAGMKARRYGRIINISSTFGIAGGPSASHYAGAKAALLGFTKGWARELGPYNITVNAVAPGFILTEMTRGTYPPERLPARIARIPIGRAGESEEITRAVLWLASDDAGFVTAQVLSPNGGEYIY